MATDDGVPGAPRFDVVLRGYDRRQVDEHVARLQRVLARMRADLETSRSQPDPIPGAPGRPGPHPRGGESPDMIGDFSDRMQNILANAEEEAEEIRSKARATARAEAESVRAEVSDLVRQRDAVLAELTRLRSQLEGLLSAPTGRIAIPPREGAPSPVRRDSSAPSPAPAPRPRPSPVRHARQGPPQPAAPGQGVAPPAPVKPDAAPRPASAAKPSHGKPEAPKSPAPAPGFRPDAPVKPPVPSSGGKSEPSPAPAKPGYPAPGSAAPGSAQRAPSESGAPSSAPKPSAGPRPPQPVPSGQKPTPVKPPAPPAGQPAPPVPAPPVPGQHSPQRPAAASRTGDDAGPRPKKPPQPPNGNARSGASAPGPQAKSTRVNGASTNGAAHKAGPEPKGGQPEARPSASPERPSTERPEPSGKPTYRSPAEQLVSMRQRSEQESEPGELFRPTKPADPKSAAGESAVEPPRGERTTLVPAVKKPDVPPQAETKSTPLGQRGSKKEPDGPKDPASTGSSTSASRSG